MSNKYELSYYQEVNGHWCLKQKIIELEPFTGYLEPEDERLKIHLPQGVLLDYVRLTPIKDGRESANALLNG